MSTRQRLLDELRRAIVLEVEAGRGRVLDDELRQKLDGPLREKPDGQLRAKLDGPRPAKAVPVVAKSNALAGGERSEQMAALAARTEACTACGLHATRNRVVTGVGALDAALMLVGEAPGHDEDQTGEPFVGRAGQLLNRILAAIGLERSDVYIANVLKCRPPNNRPPAPAEIECCSPFLFEQIGIVQPRVICALGRFAASTLLRTKSSLADLRGRVHDFRGIPVIVTYHPSALLRDPSYKRPTWEDMQVIQRLLAGVVGDAGALAVTQPT